MDESLRWIIRILFNSRFLMILKSRGVCRLQLRQFHPNRISLWNSSIVLKISKTSRISVKSRENNFSITSNILRKINSKTKTLMTITLEMTRTLLSKWTTTMPPRSSRWILVQVLYLLGAQIIRIILVLNLIIQRFYPMQLVHPLQHSMTMSLLLSIHRLFCSKTLLLHCRSILSMTERLRRRIMSMIARNRMGRGSKMKNRSSLK